MNKTTRIRSDENLKEKTERERKKKWIIGFHWLKTHQPKTTLNNIRVSCEEDDNGNREG